MSKREPRGNLNNTSRIHILTIIIFGFLPSHSADGIILPKPTGPYNIGTKSIELRDTSRTMLRSSSHRQWMMQAYYPCQSHDSFHPYMPDTIKGGFVQGVKVYAHAQPNAEPLRHLKCPIIIFIPGLGEERQKYTILNEELASHGYVVLAIDEPYVSNFVKFPDGASIVLAAKDAWSVPRDREYRYQYYDEAMAAAIQDVEYMLSYLDGIDEHLGCPSPPPNCNRPPA